MGRATGPVRIRQVAVDMLWKKCKEYIHALYVYIWSMYICWGVMFRSVHECSATSPSEKLFSSTVAVCSSTVAVWPQDMRAVMRLVYLRYCQWWFGCWLSAIGAA